MTPASLAAALRTVEPAARLVPVRHLRKVLLYLRDHGRAVPANPDLPLWVSRADLLAADVLPPAVTAGTEWRLLLLTAPDDRNLHRLPDRDQLLAYRRLLFQAGVLASIDRKRSDGSLTAGTCESRLARLGPAAAREIRFVLETDHLIDPAADAAVAYRAFAAAYLDLHHFDPVAAHEFFPSLPPAADVLKVLGEDVDVPSLLDRTRPPGTPDPMPEPPPDQFWEEAEADPEPEPAAAVSPTDTGRLLARAHDAEAKGNLVRAAVLFTQAATTLHDDDRKHAAASAFRALGKLVEAVAGVTGWDEETRAEWRQALAPLLGPAAAGIWPRAARCLYELQKIPAELSREVYAVDVVEYLRTLGRRPVKRSLVLARDVMLLMHLRAAHKQFVHSALGERQRFRLDRLFHHEIHGTEDLIRTALAPVLTAALAESGFRPANRVEEVARDKAVAELLDRACERGFLRIGDLRDAIARNQLKMPDLAGPGEWVRGDPLLRADTRLAYELDGVYRRGEAYLRALQRSSSLFFGTPVGRFLTLYLIAPFLAAFLTLMALEELRHVGGKVAAFVSNILAAEEVQFDPDEAAELVQETATSSAHEGEGKHHGSFLIAWPTVVGFGVFLLLVFHVPPFRRAVATTLRAVWHGLRLVLWDLPRAIEQSPLMRAARHSPPVRFVTRRLGGAFVLAAGTALVLSALGASPQRLLRWVGIVFAVSLVVFNTPWGMFLKERLTEQLSDWWRVVRVNLVPGLILTILEAFRRLANWMERQLYAVDEWLRFRGGDSQGSLVLKAAVGLLWFPVAYVARFTFYLLIEPQINPVKHFPVVTVSHKVILPMTPSVATALGVSDATAAGLLACIPGIFGFIAWELLANWRMYRANRPDRLQPVTIGSHGETMRGLLRPGFHSGTVPKEYRKLRAAARRGDRRTAARHHHELEHAAEAVQRFAERELVALLERSPDWGGPHVEVAAVRFGCQRAVIEVAAPAAGPDVLAVAFENRGGRIGAEVEQLGWADKLTAAQRAALVAALRGLLDMGAAELFADRERTDEPGTPRAEATTEAELLRPFSWAGWVKRWGGAA